MAHADTVTGQRLYTSLVIISLLLTLMTVSLSAYIRLSVNGLGCAPWPECYAQVGGHEQYAPSTSLTDADPTKPHGTARALHRVVATVLGVCILLIVGLSRRRGMGIPLMLLALTLFLSILGYTTPSPWYPIVTLSNLLGGMIMLALLWWLVRRQFRDPQPVSQPGFRKWAVIGMAIIVLQISVGGWTSGNYAGPACSDLLNCPAGFSTADIGHALDPMRRLDVSKGRIVDEPAMATIHQLHKGLAVVTFIYMLILGARALLCRPLRLIGLLLLVFTVLQVLLGIMSVLNGLPLLLVTGHNTVAALLLLTITDLNQKLFRTKTT